MSALEQPDIILSIAAQLPLVIAFVYFSLKIITIYQAAQTTLIEQHQSAVSKLSERQGIMIEKITADWINGCNDRDNNIRLFLTEMTDNQRQFESEMLSVIKQNNAALQSLQQAINNLQIQLSTWVGNNPTARRTTRKAE